MTYIKNGAISCISIFILRREWSSGGSVMYASSPLSDFNRFGLALVAPVTQGGQFAREHGFTVSMMGAGTKTQGVVLCNQVRMLDFTKRNAIVLEAAPETVMDQVLARVRALLE